MPGIVLGALYLLVYFLQQFAVEESAITISILLMRILKS